MAELRPEWFAGRLREIREAKGWSQPALAERAGVSVRQISRFETGEQEATWPTMLKLCEALGVDCRAFLQEPAASPEPKRGRPVKPKAEAAPSGEKLKRGRPKKGE